MDKETFTLDQPAYRLPAGEVAQLLDTNVERGLSKQEAKRRHGVVGDNALEGGEGVSIWKVLIRQVANALTLVRSSPGRLNIGAGNGDGLVVRHDRFYRGWCHHGRYSLYVS